MIYGNFANASRQGATGMIAGGTIATLAGLITTLYAWKPAREPGSHSRARYRGSR
jgi:NAD(P)H-hydrate repair Nnr-like enzyme with NAD(P)H-hydrate dehydratase domain